MPPHSNPARPCQATTRRSGAGSLQAGSPLTVLRLRNVGYCTDPDSAAARAKLLEPEGSLPPYSTFQRLSRSCAALQATDGSQLSVDSISQCSHPARLPPSQLHMYTWPLVAKSSQLAPPQSCCPLMSLKAACIHHLLSCRRREASAGAPLAPGPQRVAAGALRDRCRCTEAQNAGLNGQTRRARSAQNDFVSSQLCFGRNGRRSDGRTALACASRTAALGAPGTSRSIAARMRQ